ncbi:MAG: glycerol kinase GlpK [Desulfatibacillaceae bacterium]|nr:glycerol kinase GlpK [Desulfatibacillaceae bacterium]
MPDIIVSIDQGTTGTTVLFVDAQSHVISRGYGEIRQIYPKPGWVEHDPQNIWDSTLKAIQEARQMARIQDKDIRAVGITNQRETTLLWDRKSQKPLTNAIVWQCRRTAPLIKSLKEKGLEELFVSKTGLLLDPYFSGTKISWLLENNPDLAPRAKKGEIAAGTIDSWLIWKLTQGQSHATDATNASRTLLMDLKTQKWDDELCSILNVPKAILPGIEDCTTLFGRTKSVPGLPDNVPICGVAGDQHAALFGQACFMPGESKCTFGTGAFMLMNTGNEPVASKNRLLTTMAWKIDGKATYALEGSAFIAGALVQWLRDDLGIIKSSPDIEPLAASVPDSGGVTLVPALAGLSAPHWRPDARGLITGITRGTGRAHIARAALEGIALQNVEILLAMEKDAGRSIPRLKVDGGASANNLLMQMQADFLGCRIIRPQLVETTGLGAAFLAGLGAGIFSDTTDITRTWKEDRTFNPTTTNEERAQILANWQQAVARA